MLKIHEEMLEGFKRLDATVLVYGSVAKGRSRIDSDIDVAVITENPEVKEEAERLADEVLLEHGRVVSIVYFSPERFKKMVDRPFIRDVLSGEVLHDRGDFIKGVSRGRASIS
ncbi:MAG: nucleotidyltransferase domain-containing protein [Candidatus Bathyarchaeia archaeon]